MNKFLSIPLSTLLMITPAYAGDEHSHDHGKEAAAGKHYDIPKPTSAKEAWVMLNDALASIEKSLGANTLKSAHEPAEKVEVALHGLEEHSNAVAPENKLRLDSAIKQADKINHNMHEAVEAGDAQKAKQEIERFKKVLPFIASQYPDKELQ
jgi:hypothetical protein